MTDPIQRAVLARQLRQDPPPFDIETGEVDELVTMRVESITDGLVLPNGNVVPAGESTIRLYRSQIEAVESLVETASEEELERVASDLAWHEAQEDDSHGRHFHPSWPASFRALMKRDPLPLKSAKVLAKRGRPAKGKDDAPKGDA